MIVQWNYIKYFHIGGSFILTLCTSFWKRVHNSKEIVNLQGLFVCVDIKIYPLTNYYYIIERVYFIYRLFILFISIREVEKRLPPCQYRYFVLNDVLYY